MEERILKYQLHEQPVQYIDLPNESIILTVQTQNNTLQLWARVSDSPFVQTRKIKIFLTGEEYIHSNLIYLGTCQIDNGSLIYHIFESIE